MHIDRNEGNVLKTKIISANRLAQSFALALVFHLNKILEQIHTFLISSCAQSAEQQTLA